MQWSMARLGFVFYDSEHISTVRVDTESWHLLSAQDPPQEAVHNFGEV